MRTRWNDLNYDDDEDDVGYAEDYYQHEDMVDLGMAVFMMTRMHLNYDISKFSILTMQPSPRENLHKIKRMSFLLSAMKNRSAVVVVVMVVMVVVMVMVIVKSLWGESALGR